MSPLPKPDARAKSSKIETDRQFANNLSRGLEVLRAFTPSQPILTNRAIADRTGLPKPTISRLTYTLSLLGYLRQDDTGAYRLGTAVLSLAHPLLASMEIRQIARPHLQALADESRCTVNLAVAERNQVIYVDTIRVDVSNPYLPDIGRLSPLLHSAIGRALILAHKGEERNRLLNRVKVADPQHYEAGLELLRADQALMQEEGHCRSRGTWLPDIDAIAVPLMLPVSVGPAAINCTISKKVRSVRDLGAVAPLLRSVASKVAAAFGVAPDKVRRRRS